MAGNKEKEDQEVLERQVKLFGGLKIIRKTGICVLAAVLAVLIPAVAFFPWVDGDAVQITEAASGSSTNIWPYQCVDTVKYSRDTARSWSGKSAELSTLINQQMDEIKSLGANCVALGTPYDEEFVPFLSQWVSAARARGFIVWFRGNFSGWEGWFSYPKLPSPEYHHTKVTTFVRNHPELFENGDIFTPAPEPENGIIGNPFSSDGNKAAYKNFLVKSFSNCQQAFAQIGKSVNCGFFSVNANIAKEIFTPQLAQATGGVVVIDNYVNSPQRMQSDIEDIYDSLRVKIVLGEFGAPISDINGPMTESQQASFVKSLMDVFYSHRDEIAGVDYWTLQGGSTALLREDGSEKPVAQVLRQYFQGALVQGQVTDSLGNSLQGIKVSVADYNYQTATDEHGNFTLASPAGELSLILSGLGFKESSAHFKVSRYSAYSFKAYLKPVSPGIVYRLKELFY